MKVFSFIILISSAILLALRNFRLIQLILLSCVPFSIFCNALSSFFIIICCSAKNKKKSYTSIITKSKFEAIIFRPCETSYWSVESQIYVRAFVKREKRMSIEANCNGQNRVILKHGSHLEAWVLWLPFLLVQAKILNKILSSRKAQLEK